MIRGTLFVVLHFLSRSMQLSCTFFSLLDGTVALREGSHPQPRTVLCLDHRYIYSFFLLACSCCATHTSLSPQPINIIISIIIIIIDSPVKVIVSAPCPPTNLPRIDDVTLAKRPV